METFCPSKVETKILLSASRDCGAQRARMARYFVSLGLSALEVTLFIFKGDCNENNSGVGI